MGFSNQERINMNSAALAAGVIDANSSAQWYEKQFGFSFILNANTVWTQLSSIPTAANLTTARNNATANPTLIQDLSQASDAKRLTKVAGTNNSTFAAYSTYNDTSSTLLKNWLLPQLVPQTSGAPSNGYSINLYNGDPDSGGTLITTTVGQTGTGTTKSVGWIWNYALGILLLSDDFYSQSGISSASFDPYVVGFRYIGNTASSGVSTTATRTTSSGVADETIAVGDVLRFALNGEAGLTAGRLVKANATSVNGSEVVGIATSGGSQGASINYATSGEVAVKFGSNPATTDNGKKVFLNTTSGQATFTAPTASGQTIVRLGHINGATGSTSTPTIVLNIMVVMQIG